MRKIRKEPIIKMLEAILNVEDVEIKNCAIEALIDMLHDLADEDDEKGINDSKYNRR